MLYEFGDFVLDESTYELRRDGAPLRVDKKVFALLTYMVRRSGQLVTRGELIEKIWEGRALSETVLSGAISRARKVLGRDENLIVNVHGLGYRFAGSVNSPRSPAATPSLDAHFVGRQSAQATIRAAVQRAQTGRGSVVVIAGEPGIGKTHLAEVSAEAAGKDGVHATWGHCPALETCPPFWPIIQALRGAQRGPSSIAAREAIESALSSLESEGSSQTGDWGSAASAYRRFDSVTTALRLLTDERPWLLLLDDLQWADAASLRYLAYLAPEIAHLAIVVIATARNTEPASDDLRLAHVLGHRNCTRIELERLTSADVAEYVTRRLGKSQHELSRAVFAKSEGNPFFMLELLRSFGSSEIPEADELSVSGPALDIVRQRTRALGPSTAALLSAAAVIGRDFDVGLLAHVTELEPQIIQNGLEGARVTSIVLSVDDAGGRYTFGHDLIRSVLLESLSPSDEARLHLRTAEGLRRRYPIGDRPPRPDLVHHSLCALPLGDVHDTIELARSAALAAANACAHADAAALLRRALSALELASDPDPRLRCELLLGLSRCERASADVRFSERLTEAATLGSEHGFGEVLAEAGRHMSLAPGFTSLEGAREVLEAADRVLPQESKALRCDVLAHLAWTAPYCFDAKLAKELVDRAETLAREVGTSDALACALSAKIYFVNGPDSQEAAEAISSQIELLYADRPLLIRVHWVAQIEFSRIATSLQRGDLSAVERAIGAFGAAARKLDHAEFEWHHQRALVVHRMNRGDFPGAETELQDLQERAEQLQLFSLRGVRAVDRGVLLRETGGLSRFSHYEGLIVPSKADCPYRRARKIRSLVEVGAVDKASAALRELSPASLERLPHDRDYLATLTHLAVTSVATGSVAHSEVLYDLLSPYPHLHGADLSFHCDGSVSHFLGTLARSLGRTQASVRHLEEALERNDRAGFAARAAHSAYELATLLDDSSTPANTKRAHELLNRVCETASHKGMGPLLSAAEERLRAS